MEEKNMHWLAVGHVYGGALREIRDAGGITISPEEWDQAGVPKIWLVGLPDITQTSNSGEIQGPGYQLYWLDSNQRRSYQAAHISVSETELLSGEDWEAREVNRTRMTPTPPDEYHDPDFPDDQLF